MRRGCRMLAASSNHITSVTPLQLRIFSLYSSASGIVTFFTATRALGMPPLNSSSMTSRETVEAVPSGR